MERGISVSSKMDFKDRFMYWWVKVQFKNIMQHLSLLVIFMTYTLFGGLVFRYLEAPAEQLRRMYFHNLTQTLALRRVQLIDTIVNNTDLINLNHLIILELNDYERTLYEGYRVGFAENENFKNSENDEKWTILKAVFFSSTVLTTIGYGNIVPVTTGGRAFCIMFALVGIPLTLTVIADWGRLFATTVSTLMHHLPPLPRQCRNITVANRTASYALSAICFLFVYLSAGACLFVLWEDDWTFFDGFYFCFITMTTIGFGDLVPKKPKYMLFATMYILVGLALTSTIIELVRRQYAQSWRQLQALSGPLADNLRKLAENAPGLDVSALHNDLRKVLTVVSMPKMQLGMKSKKQDKLSQKEWEDAMEAVIRDLTTGATKNPQPPILQIVIYESSV